MYRTIENLSEILEKHELWLNDEEGGEKADLSYANLRYADLSYANLRYADLSYANLRYADLSSANLPYANLSSANLPYANLSSANLRYADLSSANLRSANLSSANLPYANLSSANLRSANLSSANGAYCNYLNSIFLDEYPITYTAEVMQIGCEKHTIEEWGEFDDTRILEMDGKTALKFWRKYKDFIFQAIELSSAKPTGYVEDKDKGND
ncbi:MAG: pentapeptide repeat-containing protein [bacterium]|nr:pentapeptide repeat-containing protein [bacterium]